MMPTAGTRAGESHQAWAALAEWVRDKAEPAQAARALARAPAALQELRLQRSESSTRPDLGRRQRRTQESVPLEKEEAGEEEQACAAIMQAGPAPAVEAVAQEDAAGQEAMAAQAEAEALPSSHTKGRCPSSMSLF